MKIKVFISCADPLSCAGLTALMNGQSDIEVIGQSARVEDALGQIPAAGQVVAVVWSPHCDLAALRALALSAKVVTFAEIGDDLHPAEVLTLNVRAVLPPMATPQELMQAIRVVAAGDMVLMPMEVHRQAKSLVQRATTTRRGALVSQLTKREEDVLGLLAEGLSNADIARKLTVSDATVRSHVHHILQKFAVPSRAQAVIAAYEAGLVAPPTANVSRLPARQGWRYRSAVRAG